MNKDKRFDHPLDYFRRNRISLAIAIIVVIALAFLTGRLIGFEFTKIFTNMGTAVSRFFELYMPPNFKEGRTLFEQIIVTFMLAVSSGLIGSLLAYIAALLISQKTSFSKIISVIVRIISTFMRNIPASIWAIILLLSFWYGEFLAFVVMAISSFGFNARVFANTFDETSSGTLEALDAVGASKLQMIGQAVTPEALPQLVSWTLYSIETNLRDSTVVGMLTGGGIGYYVDYYRQFRRFDELSAAVVFIVIAVLLFDQLTAYINEELLSNER